MKSKPKPIKSNKNMTVIKSSKTASNTKHGKLTIKSSVDGSKKAKPQRIRIQLTDIEGNKKVIRVAQHMFLGNKNLMPKITMVKGSGGKASYMAMRYTKRDDTEKYKSDDNK